MKQLVLFSTFLLSFGFFSCKNNSPTVSNPITSDAMGIHNGFNYELWHDEGDVSMTLNEGGRFECSWSNINNALFRTGKKFDQTKSYGELGDIVIHYGCDYQPVGNSYLCVYGWSVEPLVEFYIVEAWGNWRPPGAISKGTIEMDGGMYDIYETTRVNQPSIQGNTTFQQYWSVRTDKKTSGAISVSKHFKAWEVLGLKLGKMYEVALCIEGYRSSGTATIYNHTLTIGDTTLGAIDENKLPYQNPNLSSEERTKDLLTRLTLEEKARLMGDISEAIPRLGIKKFIWWNEALHGYANMGGVTVFPESIGMAASLWKYAPDATNFA
jgi:endo-1,4-beta-xylanase